MTVNVEALINSLGKSHIELVDSGLVIYKSPPKGSSGSPVLSLDMAKEGVYLSFLREGRMLQEVTVKIIRPDIKNWIFPNELPFGLQHKMSRQWVHENIGVPLRSTPPRVIMKWALGWADLFDIKDINNPTSMQIDYDIADNVMDVSFMPTSELRW